MTRRMTDWEINQARAAMNTPEENRDYSGLAHREPTEAEKLKMALDTVNLCPPSEEADGEHRCG